MLDGKAAAGGGAAPAGGASGVWVAQAASARASAAAASVRCGPKPVMRGPPRSYLFLESDLFRKPVPTFRDHARIRRGGRNGAGQREGISACAAIATLFRAPPEGPASAANPKFARPG